MSNQELKPCPLCGSGVFFDAEHIKIMDKLQKNFIECHGCGLRLDGDITKLEYDPYEKARLVCDEMACKDTVKRWNSSPIEQAMQANLDIALEALYEIMNRTWGSTQGSMEYEMCNLADKAIQKIKETSNGDT